MSESDSDYTSYWRDWVGGASFLIFDPAMPEEGMRRTRWTSGALWQCR